jgi:hypothetical protein
MVTKLETKRSCARCGIVGNRTLRGCRREKSSWRAPFFYSNNRRARGPERITRCVFVIDVNLVRSVMLSD